MKKKNTWITEWLKDKQQNIVIYYWHKLWIGTSICDLGQRTDSSLRKYDDDTETIMNPDDKQYTLQNNLNKANIMRQGNGSKCSWIQRNENYCPQHGH